MPAPRHLRAAAVGAALLFALLAWWVRAGGSRAYDLAMRDAVHAWASPLATRVLIAVTTLGTHWVLLPLGALAVWRLAVAGRPRHAILLGVGSLVAEAASDLLKSLLHRPRPLVYFGLAPAVNYSFPSGHAFVGTVFYGLLAAILCDLFPRRRAYIVAAAVALVLAIGFSRIYLGYHYPTDVLGGWLAAAAWLAMTWLWWFRGAAVDDGSERRR